MSSVTGLRITSLMLGGLSAVFSLLSLHYFLKRRPPAPVRQHVGRVTWTYIAFVTVSCVDTATHIGHPVRWQLFGYAIVFILAINAQAPLVSYERQAAKFGGPAGGQQPSERTPLTSATLLIIATVLVLMAAAAVLPKQLRTPGFDPLRFPKQLVSNRIDGVDGPAMHLGEELQVVAEKCNTSGKEIGVSGRSRWVSVDPGGSIIDGTAGSGLRPAAPRCPKFHYSNKLPDGVVARTQELFDEGRQFVTWSYTGTEVPLGQSGVERAWGTELFRIVR